MSPRPILLVLLALLLSGCGSTVAWLGVRLLYENVPPTERVWLDLPYREDADSDPVKHRLDLFLPEGDDWPVLIFVHGGGWTAGDKSLRAGGADVYSNIGRFYASQGIGTAVINYRLQPAVTWREQVDDVARAIGWVHDRAESDGGNPDALFVMGHSAGAQLAAYVALDDRRLTAAGLSQDSICGVIPVSGAGYDLADDKTYALGAERAWYEERFRAGDTGNGWLRDASAIHHISDDAPPFMLVHVTNEWKSLHHQNRLFHAALEKAGAQSQLIVIQGQGHNRMVLNLSRGDKTPAPEILKMIRESPCTVS